MKEFQIWIQVWIRIQPLLFKHHWKFFLEHLKFSHKKELPTISNFLFQSTFLQYMQSRIRRPKIKYLFIYSLIFGRIRIRINSS